MAFITNLLLSSKIGGLFKVAVRPTAKRLKSIQKGVNPADNLPSSAEAFNSNKFLAAPRNACNKIKGQLPCKNAKALEHKNAPRPKIN